MYICNKRRVCNREELVSEKERKDSRENSGAPVCVKHRQLSIQLPGRLVLTSCFTFRRCGLGKNKCPLVLLAQCCFLCFTRGRGGGECLLACQICHRVQRESQPASIRALNHDSVYADRPKDKLFRCNSILLPEEPLVETNLHSTDAHKHPSKHTSGFNAESD